MPLRGLIHRALSSFTFQECTLEGHVIVELIRLVESRNAEWVVRCLIYGSFSSESPCLYFWRVERKVPVKGLRELVMIFNIDRCFGVIM